MYLHKTNKTLKNPGCQLWFCMQQLMALMLRMNDDKQLENTTFYLQKSFSWETVDSQ